MDSFTLRLEITTCESLRTLTTIKTLISKILWNLEVDELINELENEGVYEVDYADDFGISVRGKRRNITESSLEGPEDTSRIV